MATDEIAVAGANQFNNDLTFTKVTVPPLNHWTVVIDNLAAMIQNAAQCSRGSFRAPRTRGHRSRH